MPLACVLAGLGGFFLPVVWSPLACALAWLCGVLFPVVYFYFLCGLPANCPGPGGCACSRLIFACASGLADLSLFLLRLGRPPSWSSSVVGRPLPSVVHCCRFSPLVIFFVSLRTLGLPSRCAASIRRIHVDTLGVTCDLKGGPVAELDI